MPLILITGYPSSGKTTRAEKLKSLFEEKIKNEPEGSPTSSLSVVLINDEKLSIEKESYRDSRTEKATRGIQMSEVKRELSKSKIVILDNLTYIKGFRYQLFCEAKALTTNSCVFHIMASPEICHKWNTSKKLEAESKGLKDNSWPDDILDALIFRYEEPNGQSRWDSPLFSIAYDDPDSMIPVDDIWNCLILQKAKPPNKATAVKQATSTNFLYELDKSTQDVIKQILEIEKISPSMGPHDITIKLSNDDKVTLEIPVSQISLAQLQRIRRSFIALNRMRTLDTDRIQPIFVDFLNTNFNSL